MRQDILTKQIIDRRKGGTVTYKMERGTAGDLLFVLSAGSFNHKDIITVKLRHAGGVDVLVDRISALLLGQLCDLKRGRPSTGTASYTQPEGGEQLGETKVEVSEAFYLNAFKVNLGHISLQDAKSEIEITVELAKAFGNDVRLKIANLEPKAGPDYIIQYDKSYDIEATHMLVREVYLFGRTGESLLDPLGANGQVVGKDINVMLYTDGGQGAYETDLEILAATTSIEGEMSGSISNLVCAYQDHEALPTPSLRLKITGEHSNTVGLLLIKEKMIQPLTSVSTIVQVDKALAKTEAIERMDPSVAQAYRHAGAARPSEDLVEMKDFLVSKTPNA